MPGPPSSYLPALSTLQLGPLKLPGVHDSPQLVPRTIPAHHRATEPAQWMGRPWSLPGIPAASASHRHSADRGGWGYSWDTALGAGPAHPNPHQLKPQQWVPAMGTSSLGPEVHLGPGEECQTTHRVSPCLPSAENINHRINSHQWCWSPRAIQRHFHHFCRNDNCPPETYGRRPGGLTQPLRGSVRKGEGWSHPPKQRL